MLPEVESFRVQSLWLLNPQGRSKTFINISLSIVNSKARFYTYFYACFISPKCGSALNTHGNDFIRTYIGRMTSRKRKIVSGIAVKGEGGVAGEGRVVGVPKFHSWGKCTMPLTNINSDWISNAFFGLCINLVIYVMLFTRVLFFASWGVITVCHLYINLRHR